MAIVSLHVAGAAKIHILGFMRSHTAQSNVLTDNKDMLNSGTKQMPFSVSLAVKSISL